MDFKNILILAPHLDDAELGCGGSIVRWLEEGRNINVAAFATTEEILPQGMQADARRYEFLESMTTLGVPNENLRIYNYPVRRLSSFRQEVLEELVLLRPQIQPDLVLVPSANDTHQDHQVMHMEGIRAFKDISIIAYELPWNHVYFSTQGFISLEARHIEKKWLSLQAYKSQFNSRRGYFSLEFIRSLAIVRGNQIKEEFAEAFEVIRIRI